MSWRFCVCVSVCISVWTKIKDKQNVKSCRLDYPSAIDLGAVQNLPDSLVSREGKTVALREGQCSHSKF